MKKLLSVAVLILSFHVSDAQILNKIKQKAKQVATETVNEAASGHNRGSSSSEGGSSKITESPSTVASKAVGKQKSDIIFSTTRGGAAKTDFSLNDNIYGRIMLDQPLQKALYDQDKDKEPFVLIPINLIFIENNAAHGEYVNIKILKEDYTKNYIDFDILPSADDIQSEYFIGGRPWQLIAPIRNFGDNAAGGPDFGKQQFEVNFGPNEAYQGHFNLTVANIREGNAMKQRIINMEQGMKLALAKKVQIPDVFKRPSGKNSDPQLSYANIFKMLDAPDFKVLKLTIDPDGTTDYNIQKNALDIPEYKITARPVWVVYKNPKGECYFTRYYFKRNYEGGGKYGPLEIATTTADHTMIACENVK